MVPVRDGGAQQGERKGGEAWRRLLGVSRHQVIRTRMSSAADNSSEFEKYLNAVVAEV